MPVTIDGFNRIYTALIIALTLIVGVVLWEGYEISRNQANIRTLKDEMGMLRIGIQEQQRQGKQLDRIELMLKHVTR